MIRLTRASHYLRANKLFGTRLSRDISTTKGPLLHYKQLVNDGVIIEDNHQLAALELLQRLYDELVVSNLHREVRHQNPSVASSSDSSFFGSIFSREVQPSSTFSTTASITTKSIYLWGGTGCGKTFIMDLFYSQLPIEKKRRVHFNDFMIDVHKRFHQYKLRNAATGSRGAGRAKSDDHAIFAISQELMKEAFVICFDEFQVTDIADAVIVRSLFSAMFNQGAILVATSNRPPSDLYKNGLQRDLFLPFIQLLTKQSIIHSLSASTIDYRLVKHNHVAKSMYLTPATLENIALFDNQYLLLQKEESFHLHTSPLQLHVYGHILNVPSAIIGRRVAKFEFNDLCEAALGAADFIDLAAAFRIIFISNVPKLSLLDRNSLRRLIVLIDALYDASVQVVIVAEETPQNLLQLSKEEKAASSFDEVFAFDRTVSRLLEMQSVSYFETSSSKMIAPHTQLANLFSSDSHTLDRLKQSIPRMQSYLHVLSLLDDERIKEIFSEYNWGRGTSTNMPTLALEVLQYDLVVAMKYLEVADMFNIKFEQSIPPQSHSSNETLTFADFRNRISVQTI